jgi:hypothetical protein
MVARNAFIALIGATLLSWSSPSAAEPYRYGEFFHLDLSSAVLSPKPLGPAMRFAAGPLDVSIDRSGEGAQVRAMPAEPTYEVKARAVPAEPSYEADADERPEPKVVIHSTRVAEPRAELPKHAARAQLAHHQRNPLDAQAFDARIQTWPCRSGGICSWKR